MTDLTIKQGALRYTVKGASPLVVTQGSALMVVSPRTPIVKSVAVPHLRLVQKAS